MVTALVTSATLTDAQFNEVSDLVKGLCGINLHDGKKELVKARLSKRLRTLGMTDFQSYLDHVQADASGAELVAMLDAVSTNLTHFFREPDHFDYLGETVAGRYVTGRTGRSALRVWSAGCSSGEEPYSIAITLCENIPSIQTRDVKILATDISTRMVARAREALYDESRIRELSPKVRSRYFLAHRDGGAKRYEVTEEARRLVSFARLNLMEPWPMRGPFDVIFCRNVMIYFDKPTQQRLIDRFHDLLAPGGILFIGHSESLAGVAHRFRYVQPTVYERP